MQSSNSHLQYTIESQRITQKHILSPLALSSTLLHSTLPHSILLCSPVVYSTPSLLWSTLSLLCFYSTLLYPTLLLLYLYLYSTCTSSVNSTYSTRLYFYCTLPLLYLYSTFTSHVTRLYSNSTLLWSTLLPLLQRHVNWTHWSFELLLYFRNMLAGHNDLWANNLKNHT